MTQKELFLSLKSYEDFDKNRGAFKEMPFDDEIREHCAKIFPKAYAPKDMHREVRLIEEE
jgi:hypothetical protein